ncbi:hypothetical protein PWR63_31210 [Paraburkholderia sp. A2WS-5]|uniref:hypothetical protein n=1 Tax=unclassified Paraburkholderia TaxID=2615204 RepID=UPI003B7DA4E0
MVPTSLQTDFRGCCAVVARLLRGCCAVFSWFFGGFCAFFFMVAARHRSDLEVLLMFRSPLPRARIGALDNRKDVSNIASAGQSVAIGHAAIRDRLPVARAGIGALRI